MLHAFPNDCTHLLQFTGGRRAADLSHHAVADFSLRDKVDDVDADAAGRKLIEELPDVAASAAAVACDERGAALREIAVRLARFAVENRIGAVVVQVDKARSDDEAFSVDYPVGGMMHYIADVHDSAPGNRPGAH